MKRKIILPLSLTVFFSLGLGLTLNAQDYYKKQQSAPIQKAREDIASQEKYKDLEKSQQAILKKLDQVINGQEKILQELEIIKIRASLK